MKNSNPRLRITEIFHSLQGESTFSGLPTVFIRLTGCPLRCQYCDTSYAFSGGTMLSLEEILVQISSFNCPRICVTGGEPLAQNNCYQLLEQLCNQGYSVSIETSGARDISNIDPRVIIVMDLKTPDSLEHEKNLFTNVAFLKPDDQVKFVICSRKDYKWACRIIKNFALDKIAQVLFSPSWNQLDATSLANWIIEDSIPVRFQLQLHKILWGDQPGY